jgi:cell division protein ZapA (FtsZ GTPase activity inhibitor)
MVSVMTVEEMKTLKEKLKSTREQVRDNRQEAIRVLKAAGIATKDGKLTSRYRGTRDL